MRKSKIIKFCLALFLTCSLIMIVVGNGAKAKADVTTSTYADYQGKYLFVPREAISELYFYLPYNSTPTSYNIGKIWIYSTYPYQANVNGVNLYAYRKSTTNNNQNGLYYTGGGSLNYLTYSSGSYQVNTWSDNPNYPTRYIIIEFTSSLGQYLHVPNLSDLFTKGCVFLEGTPNTNSYLFYSYLGGYLASKDSQESYQKGVNDVISNPNNYNLFTEGQLDDSFDNGYYTAMEQVESESLNYTNVLKASFDSASSLMNVQVFPNITIGLIIGLPLLLGLFIIVLKLIRG